MNRPASLRTTIVAATSLMAGLAVLVSGSLVGLTTILHRTTVATAASVDSVLIAEEAEIDLLLHERASEVIVRRSIETELRANLAEARRFVTTPEEARVLQLAQSRVDSYIAARDPAERELELEAAYSTLEELVALNVAQSHVALADAAWWNNLGKVVGAAASSLFVILACVLLAWLRTRAFDPILALSRALERFAHGDRSVRSPEHGPRELREMSTRFNQMAAAISTQREAQMAFLGGVAHDLRSPLSALRLSVAVLAAEKRPGPDDEHFRATVERISRQIIRMDRMLGDFVDVTKIEAGQLDLRLATHDVRALVEEVVDMFEGALDRPIELRLPAHGVPLRCDPLRIEQVLTNLISNAIKYSPEGSPILVSLDANGDDLLLTVTDHGVGISTEDRPRIFEPFRRVGLLQGNVPGAGLGLFVVRKIVEAHRGRIEVESAPGQGSAFRVILPAVPNGGHATVH